MKSNGNPRRALLVVALMLCLIVVDSFGTTMDVYFTHPYGGIHMMSSSGQVSTVLPDVGRCTGITFGENGNLYFGRWYDDCHRINLMMMSPDRNLTDLGIIVQIGAVVLRWDEDIAVIPEPATLLLLGLGGLFLRRRK